MDNSLKIFKEKINQNLLCENIKERNDGKTKILGVNFTKNNKDFIIIRQENHHKSQYTLLDCPKEENYVYKTNLSCDFIVIYSKNNKVKISFFEIKSSTTELEKARCQILYSRLWLEYFFKCYSFAHKIDIDCFNKALNESKYFMLYPRINNINLKQTIGENNKNKRKYKEIVIQDCCLSGKHFNINPYNFI
ncbi:hypothetical protein IY804_06965 [Campylobacter volucris]|uniref:hypothetical protein n=1 Tax=Campylobacter volucris TaxID=1031542 RepID=UPI00105A00AD|nr:hypothetical protein [Campylobacter volucris]MBF7045486.1 hypothetical protein [Campylobacter volucris]MBF7047808.1 hypothetical protein [Campylobacter volucris]TDJ80914.1 hypothetical protein E2O25_06805 [Campylobacter volucris]